MKRQSYIHKTLTPGEKIIYEAKVHPALYIAMIPTFLLFEALFYYFFGYIYTREGESLGIIFWIAMLLPFLLFVQSWLVINTTELALTNRRVIAKTGIVTQRTSELQIGQVESVEVEQGLLGRFLNYGTVTVKGTGGGSSPAPGIVEPLGFRKAVQELTQSLKG